MGWDAFSTGEMSKGRKYQLKHKKLRQAFKAACDEVRTHADSIDGGLDVGILGCSACRDMLQKAFKGQYSVYTDWPPEAVIELNKIADWNFRYAKEDAWAYWSARVWLRVCAENGLGVTFSY